MSLIDQALANVKAISPYQAGKPITQLARELGLPVEKIVKLASNENPLGMSPKAQQAVAEALLSAQRYPDDFELKAAVARHSGLDAKHIVLGNGSNDLLDLIARVFLCAGRAAIYSQYAFAVYPLATLSTGAEPIEVPAHDFGHDLDAMLAALKTHKDKNPRLIWIANPNNPTGNFAPYPALKAFLKTLALDAPDVMVVLDEAYNDYIPLGARENTTLWLREFPNLLLTRTFSKIYGLAGLRVGYALASAEIADLMNRVRQPFNCNNLALAGAIAALDDTEFLEKSYALNQAGMAQIVAGLDALGLSYIPSYGNFLSFQAAKTAAKTAEINQKLLKQGVIVRPLVGYHMPQWLRVTIGSAAENACFLTALSVALKS